MFVYKSFKFIVATEEEEIDKTGQKIATNGQPELKIISDIAILFWKIEEPILKFQSIKFAPLSSYFWESIEILTAIQNNNYCAYVGANYIITTSKHLSIGERNMFHKKKWVFSLTQK